MSKLKKAMELVRAEGLEIALRYCASYFACRFLNNRPLSIEDIYYQKWRRKNSVSVSALKAILAESVSIAYRPLISVIMPVYNAEPRLLRRAVQSVEKQLYSNWELCIADDCSTRVDTRAEIEWLAARQKRIKVRFLSRNVGIGAASNAAIELSEGEFIALLDHDDELSADALFETVKVLNEYPDIDMIYSDEDKLDERGKHIEAFLKPDWSPHLLLSNMYTGHLGVYRKRLIDSIGGFREGFEGAQDYDLVLRVTERTEKIHHIPKVLYHWRRLSGSTSVDYETTAGGKSATSSSLRALEEALERRKISGKVEKGFFNGSYRIRPAIPSEASVTIIIPTRDKLSCLQKCVESIRQKTTYRNYDIIIVDNQSVEAKTQRYLSSLGKDRQISVIRYDAEFNFSLINNLSVNHADGDFLVFLNNDIEVIEPGWLEAMLELMQIPEVAVVGAKLLYPDDTVQHAGVALWHGGVAGHVHCRLPKETHGYFGMANTIRDCTAVSAACMMVKKKIFKELGGFDDSYVVSYQDVDFCLRVREMGCEVVFTPFALLYHHESASTGFRTDEREERLFRERWRKKILADKYYNPNFPCDNLDFRLK